MITVKELSQKTGLKPKDIRRFAGEFEDLLSPHVQTDAQDRMRFGPAAVRVFERIGRLKKSGFTFPDVCARIEKEFGRSGLPEGMSGSRTPNGRHTVILAAVLAVVTLAVFWRVTGADFISLDDPRYVTENPQVLNGLTGETIAWALKSLDARTGNWHPLTYLSHMLDVELFGLNPGMHHLVNLLLHTGNAVLLFLLLCFATGRRWPSVLVAALFALHPLHVESVAWVSERKDVLSTFFWLATMWAYGTYSRNPRPGWYLLVLLLFCLGLSAKPMLVTLPFVLLLWDYWPLGRLKIGGSVGSVEAKGTPGSLTKLLAEKVPFFVLSAVSIILTLAAQQKGQTVAPMDLFSPAMRIANALTSYVGYIGKMLWPAGLAVYYPYPQQIPFWQSAGAGLLIAALTAGCLIPWRKYPYLAVGWLWYVGTLVPVIGLVQVGGQAMADRYSYIPLIGLFISIAWGGAALLKRLRLPDRLGWATAGIVLVVLASCTWVQTGYWQNSLSLYRHTLAVTRPNPAIHRLLAYDLLQKGDLDGAISHYREVLRIDPQNPQLHEVHDNLGSALMVRGKTKEAIAHFRSALTYQPNQAETLFKLGSALMINGDTAAAIDAYRAALESKPDFERARVKLAETYNRMGLELASKGQFKEALIPFQKALDAKPDLAETHSNLGVTLTRLGRYDDAVAHFQKVLKRIPNHAETHAHIGSARLLQKRYPEAIDHLKIALRLKPDLTVARQLLERAEAARAEAAGS